MFAWKNKLDLIRNMSLEIEGGKVIRFSDLRNQYYAKDNDKQVTELILNGQDLGSISKKMTGPKISKFSLVPLGDFSVKSDIERLNELESMCSDLDEKLNPEKTNLKHFSKKVVPHINSFVNGFKEIEKELQELENDIAGHSSTRGNLRRWEEKLEKIQNLKGSSLKGLHQLFNEPESLLKQLQELNIPGKKVEKNEIFINGELLTVHLLKNMDVKSREEFLYAIDSLQGLREKKEDLEIRMLRLRIIMQNETIHTMGKIAGTVNKELREFEDEILSTLLDRKANPEDVKKWSERLNQMSNKEVEVSPGKKMTYKQISLYWHIFEKIDIKKLEASYKGSLDIQRTLLTGKEIKSGSDPRNRSPYFPRQEIPEASRSILDRFKDAGIMEGSFAHAMWHTSQFTDRIYDLKKAIEDPDKERDRLLVKVRTDRFVEWQKRIIDNSFYDLRARILNDVGLGREERIEKYKREIQELYRKILKDNRESKVKIHGRDVSGNNIADYIMKQPAPDIESAEKLRELDQIANQFYLGTINNYLMHPDCWSDIVDPSLHTTGKIDNLWVKSIEELLINKFEVKASKKELEKIEAELAKKYGATKLNLIDARIKAFNALPFAIKKEIIDSIYEKINSNTHKAKAEELEKLKDLKAKIADYNKKKSEEKEELNEDEIKLALQCIAQELRVDSMYNIDKQKLIGQLVSGADENSTEYLALTELEKKIYGLKEKETTELKNLQKKLNEQRKLLEESLRLLCKETEKGVSLWARITTLGGDNEDFEKLQNAEVSTFIQRIEKVETLQKEIFAKQEKILPLELSIGRFNVVSAQNSGKDELAKLYLAQVWKKYGDKLEKLDRFLWEECKKIGFTKEYDGEQSDKFKKALEDLSKLKKENNDRGGIIISTINFNDLKKNGEISNAFSVIDEDPRISNITQIAVKFNKSFPAIHKLLVAAQKGTKYENYVELLRTHARTLLDILDDPETEKHIQSAKEALKEMKDSYSKMSDDSRTKEQLKTRIDAIENFVKLLENKGIKNVLQTILDKSKFNESTFSNWLKDDGPKLAGGILLAVLASVTVVGVFGITSLAAISLANAGGMYLGNELASEGLYHLRQNFDEDVKNGKLTYTNRAELMKWLNKDLVFDEEKKEFIPFTGGKVLGNALKHVGMDFAIMYGTLGLGRLLSAEINTALGTAAKQYTDPVKKIATRIRTIEALAIDEAAKKGALKEIGLMFAKELPKAGKSVAELEGIRAALERVDKRLGMVSLLLHCVGKGVKLRRTGFQIGYEPSAKQKLVEGLGKDGYIVTEQKGNILKVTCPTTGDNITLHPDSLLYAGRKADSLTTLLGTVEVPISENVRAESGYKKIEGKKVPIECDLMLGEGIKVEVQRSGEKGAEVKIRVSPEVAEALTDPNHSNHKTAKEALASAIVDISTNGLLPANISGNPSGKENLNLPDSITKWNGFKRANKLGLKIEIAEESVLGKNKNAMASVETTKDGTLRIKISVSEDLARAINDPKHPGHEKAVKIFNEEVSHISRKIIDPLLDKNGNPRTEGKPMPLDEYLSLRAFQELSAKSAAAGKSSDPKNGEVLAELKNLIENKKFNDTVKLAMKNGLSADDLTIFRKDYYLNKSNDRKELVQRNYNDILRNEEIKEISKRIQDELADKLLEESNQAKQLLLLLGELESSNANLSSLETFNATCKKLGMDPIKARQELIAFLTANNKNNLASRVHKLTKSPEAIQAGEPGIVRPPERLSPDDVVDRVRTDQKLFTTIEIEKIINSLPPDVDRDLARRVLGRMTQLGNLENLGRLNQALNEMTNMINFKDVKDVREMAIKQLHTEKGKNITLDTLRKRANARELKQENQDRLDALIKEYSEGKYVVYTGADGGLAMNLIYLAQKGFIDRSSGNIRVREDLQTLLTTGIEEGKGYAFIVDEHFLRRLETDPIFLRDFQLLLGNKQGPRTMLIIPESWETGINAFSKPSEIQAKLLETTKKVQGLQQQGLDADRAISKALNKPIRDRLNKLNLGEENGFKHHTLRLSEDSSKLTIQDLVKQLSTKTITPEQLVSSLKTMLGEAYDSHAQYALELLARDLHVFSLRRQGELCRELHSKIMAQAKAKGINQENVYYVVPIETIYGSGVGTPIANQSYGLVTMQYRMVNGIPAEKIITMDKLNKLPENSMVVVLDDLCATGESLNNKYREIRKIFKNGEIVIAPLVTSKSNNIFYRSENNPIHTDENKKLIFLPAKEISDFRESEYFQSLPKDVQEKFKNIMFGGGYKDGGLLIIWEHMVPNNNLGIINAKNGIAHLVHSQGAIKLDKSHKEEKPKLKN